MGAVVVVRDGLLPAGAAEAVAECGGAVLLVGQGVNEAAGNLPDCSGQIRGVELGPFAAGAWAQLIAPLVADWDIVVLPASADGRDLAPRLAFCMDRPLLAGALAISASEVTLGRLQARVTETHRRPGRIVATLLAGARGVDPLPTSAPATATDGRVELIEVPDPDTSADASILEVSDPDPATMDLSEAHRVVVGGAGLGRPEEFEVLDRVAAGLRASPGATRVVADAGWVSGHRYIGTTGVSVQPELYVAFGVSGAVQHTTGIGHPDHIVAVNTDPSAPMMGLADLAVVADAPAVMAALVERLSTGADGAQEPA